MKFEIVLERDYPHPIDTVWRALTDPSVLEKWLMETDFTPVVGRTFNMWCDNGDGETDRYICKMLACAPPRYMRWSWIVDGHQDLGETEVEFLLQEIENGTRLTIRHTGDRDPKIIKAFKSGWPSKIDRLGEHLG